LSGGMNQRVMIAMAIACAPKLLIADEPTTALDVTIQAQIMALLLKLQREQGMGLVMITHDLAVVAEMAQRVAVMYAGQVVETGPVPGLFDAPRHPYTNALLAAIPEHNRGAARLSALPGIVPGALDRPAGCLLSPRCPRVQ
ncbi:ABC transporter ATP-binding protein, partial [Bradyrhizobium sp. NBAIM03]